jgi:DNA polymerase alpha-associated DNA helicase A
MQLPPTILSSDGDRKGKKGNATVVKSVLKDKTKETSPTPTQSDGGLSDTGSGSSGSDSYSPKDASATNAVANMSLNTQPKGKTHMILRPPRSLETTLFERLEKMHGSSIKRMLQVQYRLVSLCFTSLRDEHSFKCCSMHAQICSFPSKTLYSSKLTSHSSVESHMLRDLPNTHANSEEDEKEMLATPVVFFDTAGCEYFERLDGDGDEGSRCNENEATIVKNWVEQLVY